MGSVINSFRQNVAARAVSYLPSPVREKISPYAYGAKDMRVFAQAGNGPINCLIGPKNNVGQSHRWAQSLNNIPGVSAVSIHFTDPRGVFGFPSDVQVNRDVARCSRIWGRRQEKAINGFSHVLIESQTPLFDSGRTQGVIDHIKYLQDQGIKVGAIAYGSDVRQPSKHRALEKFSPFWGELDGLTAKLENITARNIATLDQLDIPEFITGYDLLEFRPNAEWIPTLTDLGPWLNVAPSKLGERRPVVFHLPSRASLKGSVHVEKAMTELSEAGIIDYIRVTKPVPNSQMPALVESADILIDQVGMGLYGVASIEAMAAGRIAVAHVWDMMREKIHAYTGRELPIVQADPDTLKNVVKDIAEHPEDYQHLIAEGRDFATKVHSPASVRAAMADFLGVSES